MYRVKHKFHYKSDKRSYKKIHYFRNTVLKLLPVSTFSVSDNDLVTYHHIHMSDVKLR